MIKLYSYRSKHEYVEFNKDLGITHGELYKLKINIRHLFLLIHMKNYLIMLTFNIDSKTNTLDQITMMDLDMLLAGGKQRILDDNYFGCLEREPDSQFKRLHTGKAEIFMQILDMHSFTILC